LKTSAASSGFARGFSLVEIVVALGVMAFALAGIAGLFPVAMASAQDSRRETRAALIARQLFATLRVPTGTERIADPAVAGRVRLDANTNIALAFDADGNCLTNPVATAENPSPIPGASFLARVVVDTNTGTANLSRVQATVETPAAAASSNRSKFTFVTQMAY
jgi:uncharacterized protein (TIGR02598 family)